MPSFGIIGDPVAYSLSPGLHAEFFRRREIDGSYGRFPVRDISLAVSAMRALGIAGANVTMPYKKSVIPYLDRLSPEAEAIGAVNTVAIGVEGEAVGYNTDWYGFAKSLLTSGISIAGMRFAICGCGATSNAVCYALDRYGAKQIITFSSSGNGLSYEHMEDIGGFDAIVNCTPLGAHHYQGLSPVKSNCFIGFHTAIDLNYGRESLFLTQARELGLRTINGLPMLVFQGAKSFEIWTGHSFEDQECSEICSQLACVFPEI